MEAKKYWNKHLQCINYNSNFKDNFYESIRNYYKFYDGDQWINLKGDDKLPKPTFNVTKRTIDFKTASLSSSDVAINVEPLEYNSISITDDEITPTALINSEIKNLFDKWSMRSLKKELLKDGAITGDMTLHFIFNPNAKPYRGKFPEIKGEIEVELIDCVNIEFGNPNIMNVEKQPYIIVVGRDFVVNLEKEAKEYRNRKSEFQADNDTSRTASIMGNVEITEISADDNVKDGKATYIYYYEKDKNGNVLATKCTENAIVYEKVNLGLTRYPIAHAPYYSQKNTYHGRGEIEGLIPNQLAINKMFAMVMYYQMTSAFAPIVYDGDLIDTWSNKMGTAIKVKGLSKSNKSVNDIARFLEPGNMSEWIIKVIDLTISYTKEFLGVSDAALGQIDPKNTSAIIAVQKSTAVPLENIKDNFYDLMKQVALIIIDFISAKYGLRPVLYTNKEGLRQLINYDFNQLKDMDLKTSVDVGETSYYSQLASLQTLDNTFQNGNITFIEYLERMPNELFPRKEELLTELKEREQAEKQSSYEEMSQFIGYLSPDLQQMLQQILETGGWEPSGEQPQQQQATGPLVNAEEMMT